MKVELTKELVDAIVAYLATRPWKEANNLIVEISRQSQAEQPNGKPEEKKDA